jgi:hypothetical protein
MAAVTSDENDLYPKICFRKCREFSAVIGVEKYKHFLGENTPRLPSPY